MDSYIVAKTVNGVEIRVKESYEIMFLGHVSALALCILGALLFIATLGLAVSLITEFMAKVAFAPTIFCVMYAILLTLGVNLPLTVKKPLVCVYSTDTSIDSQDIYCSDPEKERKVCRAISEIESEIRNRAARNEKSKKALQEIVGKCR